MKWYQNEKKEREKNQHLKKQNTKEDYANKKTKYKGRLR